VSQVCGVEKLPADVRSEIDRRLIAGGVGDYVALAKELSARGYRVSKSALHRYGQQLKRRVQLGRAREQLEMAGVEVDLAAEMTGEATLVVVIDRRNGRARLMNLPARAAAVIAHLKRMNAA